MNRSFFSKVYVWVLLAIILLVVTILMLSKKANKTVLQIEEVTINKVEDILPLRDDSLVTPIIYENVQELKKIPSDTRKEKFIDVMVPALLIYHHKIGQEREKIQLLMKKAKSNIAWTNEDSVMVNGYLEKYEADNLQELLDKMLPHPISLSLAQAALESGWGSSRFFEIANNVFGIWSYNRNEPRVPAIEGREDNAVFLKKYDNIVQSIEDYHLLLARSKAYADFRQCRVRGNNVFELIWYLKRYSEKRNQYVIMLRNVIVANNLTKYDHYVINPEYIEYPKDNSAFFANKKEEDEAS